MLVDVNMILMMYRMKHTQKDVSPFLPRKIQRFLSNLTLCDFMHQTINKLPLFAFQSVLISLSLFK